MKLELELEDQHFQQLEAAARSMSLDVASFIKVAASEKLTKMTPKRGGPGRPPDSETRRECKKLIKQIDLIYFKLKADSGPDIFAERHALNWSDAHNFAELEDLAGLRSFIAARPWLVK